VGGRRRHRTLVIWRDGGLRRLQATMNLIWEVRPAPTNGAWAGNSGWLKERVFSLAMSSNSRSLAPRLSRRQRRPSQVPPRSSGARSRRSLAGLLEIADSLLVLTSIFPTIQIRAGRRDSLA